MRRLLCGLALALLILIWIARKVDVSAVAVALARASPAWLLVAFSAVLLALWLKGKRWAMAIAAGGGGAPRRRLFASMLIGMAGNIALPARAGDFVRAFVLRRHNGVAAARSLTASWSVQVLDFLAVALILWGLSPGPELAPEAALATIAAVAAGIILSLAVLRRRPRLLRIDRFLPGRLSRKLTPVLERAHVGLAFLDSASAFLRVGTATAAVWVVEGLAITSGLRAFDLHPPLPAGPLLAAAIGLSFVLPLTPGNLGTYQIVTIVVLGAYGVERESAFAFGIGFQAVSHLGLLLCGFAALQREGLDWRSLPEEETPLFEP